MMFYAKTVGKDAENELKKRGKSDKIKRVGLLLKCGLGKNSIQIGENQLLKSRNSVVQ